MWWALVAWAWAAESCPAVDDPRAPWIDPPAAPGPPPAGWAALADDLARRLACRERPIEPSEAATYHLIRAHVLAASDPSQVPLALLAATSGGPKFAPAAWVPVPIGHEPARGSPWVQVMVPPGLALFVDGVPSVSRPIDRPAVYQLVGAGGRVTWSGSLSGEEDVPDVPLRPLLSPAEASAARALVDEVARLLAEGDYDRVVELAVPAVAQYPDFAEAFQAATAVAVEQRERASQGSWAALGGPIVVADRAAPRRRQGAARRGDDRSGLLLGMDVGLPVGFRGEWKIGGRAVDGMGARVGGGLLLGSVAGFSGTDTTLYLDWNVYRLWQLETAVGLFVAGDGAGYGQIGAALQYDPPTPLQVNLGARLGGPGYVAPDISIGFIW